MVKKILEKLFSTNGKYINIGLGSSNKDDGYEAAKDAAQQAIKDKAEKPTMTIVYADSKYDAEKIAKGINEVIGTNWIGTSTDTQFTNLRGYYVGELTVLCIFSQHLHFGVGYVENYKKKPVQNGETAIKMAMEKVNRDQYMDPYVQFRRAQTKKYDDIVKTLPYFALLFINGIESIKGQNVPGRETEFLEGVFNITGPNIPIIGGSASSNLNDFLQKNVTNIFHFAEGKVLRHGAVVLFVVSNLYFAHNLSHGYIKTREVGVLTRLADDGHTIVEINGKPALEEYSRLVGIDVDDMVKDPFKYTFSRPLGIIDPNGNTYIKEAMPNKDKKTMHSVMKLAENSAVTIMDFDKNKTINSIRDGVAEADSFVKGGKPPALAFVFDCCGRKALLGEDVSVEVDSVTKKYKNTPLIGFHTFGEIGGKRNIACQTVNQSVSALLIYDRLFTE